MILYARFWFAICVFGCLWLVCYCLWLCMICVRFIWLHMIVYDVIQLCMISYYCYVCAWLCMPVYDVCMLSLRVCRIWYDFVIICLKNIAHHCAIFLNTVVYNCVCVRVLVFDYCNLLCINSVCVFDWCCIFFGILNARVWLLYDCVWFVWLCIRLCKSLHFCIFVLCLIICKKCVYDVVWLRIICLWL